MLMCRSVFSDRHGATSIIRKKAKADDWTVARDNSIPQEFVAGGSSNQNVEPSPTTEFTP
jgi:hypothetical protein